MPRGQSGYWRMTGGSTVTNVYLGNDRLMACADQLIEGRSFELVHRVHHEDQKLFAIVKIISGEVAQPGEYGPMFLEHALDLLCIALMRSHSTLAVPVVRREYGLASWQIRRVVNYMRDRLGDDVTLQDLANVVWVSRFHFCTAFRRATGMTPYEYLTRMRMEKACQLLVDGHLSIGDIALAVGYGSFSGFSAAFRRYVGTSPREYRRRSN